MGRRKSANLGKASRDPSLSSRAHCSMKDPYENCTACALPEKPKPMKRLKQCIGELRYGSVTPDVFSFIARSQEAYNQLQLVNNELLSRRNKNLVASQSGNCIASQTSTAFTDSLNLLSSKEAKENHLGTPVFGPTIQQAHSAKDSFGCSESLDISAQEVPVIESIAELTEYQVMLNQEGPEICDEFVLLSSEPVSDEENSVTEMSFSVDATKGLSGESRDQIGHLLLCTDNLQDKNAEELESIAKDMRPQFHSPGCCQRDLCCQKHETAEHDEDTRDERQAESNNQIYFLWSENELKKTNELETVTEEKGTLLKDYPKDLNWQIHMEKEEDKEEKNKLNFSIETVKDLQVECNAQNTDELNQKIAEELETVQEERATELDILEDSEMDFVQQRHMQDGDDEDDEDKKDELSEFWKEMALSFECSKESTFGSASTIPENALQECNHSFVLEDDIGYVCKLCGLIGRSIETIFDFQWSKVQKGKKHLRPVPNKNMETILESDMVEILGCKSTEDKRQVFKLVMHPCLKKQMKLHQLEGFEFLQRNLITEKPGGCILAHAPGTGKTFLVISFIQSFLTKYPEERPLIVVPKSILHSWIKEFKRWEVEEIPLYNLYEACNKSEGLRCSQLQILREWRKKKSILLVSYSQFSSIVCEKTENQMIEGCQQILLEGPGLLILDEGHVPRNKDTNILHALSRIHTRRRVLLSGTLFQNNIKELFNLLKLVRPNILELASFQTIFRRLINNLSTTERYSKLLYRRHSQDSEERTFCDVLECALNDDGTEMKASAIQDLQELALSFVHYYKGDVLEDLPGLVDFTVVLNLNDKQREIIDRLQHVVENRMSRDITSAAVCIHPSLEDMHPSPEGEIPSGCLDSGGNSIADIFADPNDGVKTKFVLDMLSLCVSAQEKLLVFSQYLNPLNLIENMIAKKMDWTKGIEILRLEGSTPTEDRERIINQFNDFPDSRVLFASIRAAGEGISLTGASRVVILDIPWNPSISRQAISRAYRIGQKRKVFAYRLVAADTLEEEIHQASLKKELMSKMLFEGSNQHGNSSSLVCEVKEDECEDPFFQSSALRKNVKVLYQHTLM